MKKIAILMCIFVFLLGCTACAKRPNKQEQNDNPSQSTNAEGNTSDTSSGLGQEIIIDGDLWDIPASSDKQSGSSSSADSNTVTSAVTGGNIGTGTQNGNGTSSTTSTGKGNVIVVDDEKSNINYQERDKGWGEWK